MMSISKSARIYLDKAGIKPRFLKLPTMNWQANKVVSTEVVKPLPNITAAEDDYNNPDRVRPIGEE